MDFNALSKVGLVDQKVTDSKKVKVTDSKKAVSERKKEIIDSIKKRREERKKQISDSKKYTTFKISDTYKNLKKKIKDALEETETTEAAIEAAIAEITPDAPAEQVVASVIEILGDVIDELQADQNLEEIEEEGQE